MDQTPSSRPSQGTGRLPATYTNPWWTLLQSFQAVVADLRLRLKELWRRNREADLPTPRFWPRALAALFWPLVLIIGLIVFTSLSAALINRSSNQQPTEAAEHMGRSTPGTVLNNASNTEQSSTDRSQQTKSFAEGSIRAEEKGLRSKTIARNGITGEGITGESMPTTKDSEALISEPSASEPSVPEPSVSEPKPAETLAKTLGLKPTSASNSQAMLSEPSQTDQILAMLSDGDVPEGLLQSVKTKPQANKIVLVLGPAWGELNAARQLAIAQRWQRQIEDIGYVELQLQDQKSQLLGKSAQVGVGMIMFDQASS